MNFFGLLWLLVIQFTLGKALLVYLKLEFNFLFTICLSMLCGVCAVSLIPMIVQLFHLPLTVATILTAILAITICMWFPIRKKIKQPKLSKFSLPAFYELPFLFAIIALVIISVWRCFYYPPIARDLVTGPELIAEYAVREHSLINSVFSIDLSTTNNIFKSPFITGLQIVYKIFVCPFGDIWLSIIFISFIVFLAGLLMEKLHPIISYLLLFLFLTIPELFAYTYLVLYDYSNMVFFFLGTYFLSQFFIFYRYGDFIFSSLLLGMATYIRNETIIFIMLFIPLIILLLLKQGNPIIKIVGRLTAFSILPLSFYAICNYVYTPLFVPIHFSANEQLNKHIFDLTPFFTRFHEINNQLLFSPMGIFIYGYFIYLFLGVLILDIVLFRKLTTEALFCVYGIFVVYFGLTLVGYLIPIADLLNTTKRGLFKLFPIMLLYYRNSQSILWLSAKLTNYSSRQISN